MVLSSSPRWHAWAAVIANQAALPGLGSLLAGQRVGWIQVILALTGFVLTLWWAVGFVAEWIHTGSLPLELNRRFLIGLGGVVLFLIAWLWSLATSLQILRGRGL